ncbi:phospholipid phosphatase 4-like [Corticium candelabrum]|uniref:phospholipid phosphatase 4-like n=1 Tax=Corticium candelabrum TaxID=121492 RepID=UPI002E258FD2|nr:phospholipid phosphatase 4-like [Corticium candelabrum]
MSSRVLIVVEIALRIVLFVVFLQTENVKPFIRVIQQEEIWLYKNPISPDTITPNAVFAISIGVPLICILLRLLYSTDKSEMGHALLGLTLALTLNAVITNFIKLAVGRPRPDFFYRCFPDGIFKVDWRCTGDPVMILEGRKSFPSGHSSWSFAGLGYLSLYWAGKLHCFSSLGRGQSWRLVAAFSPAFGALLIAVSRTCDYKHHWQDVIVGSLLGFGIAYVSYRQYFPSLTNRLCHSPHSSVSDHTMKARHNPLNLETV